MTFWFIFVVAMALYVGALYHKEIMDFIRKVDRFLDKNVTKETKRKRRANLKRKYGFDDSYDKYIA